MASGILRLPAVMKLTGLSRSSIYLMISSDSFPARCPSEQELSAGERVTSTLGLISCRSRRRSETDISSFW
jgi:Prophage CP4-57 regulatory protein (AlpA)